MSHRVCYFWKIAARAGITDQLALFDNCSELVIQVRLAALLLIASNQHYQTDQQSQNNIQFQ